ncbi:Wzz/FepE/Etk N-terminal domain-containing protein [Lentisalinibacter orientalis]|uniref:Wzz/FepE/Etk N-terminal domain-containing protein n=1 Tax=Lentisalinibacter orientalis TaxID=2992241 RepID=UPI00386834C6
MKKPSAATDQDYDALNSIALDEVTISRFLRAAWLSRIWILCVALAAGIAAGAYVMIAPDWYRAEVVLSPANDQSVPQIPSELGGVASLIGLDVSESTAVEARAVLESRDLAREFIEKRQLLPVFFEGEWDAKNQRWRVDQEDQPDVRDGIQYFADNVRVLREEAGNDLLSLQIQWKNPAQAAEWANELVSMVNHEMRTRVLREAQARIEYLDQQISQTNQLATQQALSRVLERELQKVVLAQGNEQYAFRVLDSAQIPKYPYHPKKLLIVITSMLFAAVLAFIVAYVRLLLRVNRSMHPQQQASAG